MNRITRSVLAATAALGLLLSGVAPANANDMRFLFGTLKCKITSGTMLGATIRGQAAFEVWGTDNKFSNYYEMGYSSYHAPFTAFARTTQNSGKMAAYGFGTKIGDVKSGSLKKYCKSWF